MITNFKRMLFFIPFCIFACTKYKKIKTALFQLAHIINSKVSKSKNFLKIFEIKYLFNQNLYKKIS